MTIVAHVRQIAVIEVRQTVEVRQTGEFANWLSALHDSRAVRGSTSDRGGCGSENFGDVKPVGEGVSEVRVHYGPGYRLYLVRRGGQLIVLLCGGDKSSQARDIKRARALAGEL